MNLKKFFLYLLFFHLYFQIYSQNSDLDILKQDIKTSNYYSLIKMLEDNDLDIKGNIETLKNRLLSYYDIPIEKAGDNNIQLKQASNAKSFTKEVLSDISKEKVKEQNIELDGGVDIEIKSKDNTTHKIKADKIHYNQEKGYFTAEGNIEYEYFDGNKTEKFKGNIVSFEMDEEDALFLNGSSQDSKVENEDGNLIFIAEVIKRSKDNTIILDFAKITKSRYKIPNYYIKARKVWILSSVDWGIKDAVLYVGEVPMLYIPYFFVPNQEMIFHPSVGYDNVFGGFLQTTTYLLGQKKREKDDELFALFNSFFDDNKQKEARDLFLENKDIILKEDNEVKILKFLVDGYTNLGFFTGLEGSFTKGILKKADFNIGIGISKYIYESDDDNPIYIDRFLTEQGDAKIFYASSNINKTNLPFRFGFDFQQKLSNELFSLDLNLDIYSDPYFKSDFIEKRSQRIEWFKILETSANGNFFNSSTNKSVLNNTLDFRLKPSLYDSAIYPYIKNIDISNLDFEYTFRNKKQNNIPDYVKYAYNSPEAYFYYPDNIKTPYFRLDISGDLYNYPKKEKKYSSSKNDLLKPWEQNEDKKEEKEDDFFKIKDDEEIDRIENNFTYNLNYKLIHIINNQGEYLYSRFNSNNDISLDTDYMNFLVKNIFNLNSNLTAYNRLIEIDNNLKFENDYQFYYNFSKFLEKEDEKYLIDRAYSFKKDDILLANSIKIRPFNTLNYFNNSILYYNFDSFIFRNKIDYFSELENRLYYKAYTTLWNPYFIKDHNIGFNLDYSLKNGDFNQHYSSDFKFTLTPLDFDFNNITNFNFSIANLKIESGLDKRDDFGGIKSKPISFTFNYSYPEWLKLSQIMTYNIEDKYIDNLKTRLDLAFFYTSFSFVYDNKYDFDNNLKNFVISDDEKLRPGKLEVGINLKYISKLYWKNRIKFDFSINTWVDHSFLKFSEFSLNFNFKFNFYVLGFLTIYFDFSSSNKDMYLYFDKYMNNIGAQKRDFFKDLGDSLNIFKPEKLKGAHFELNYVKIGLIHDLGDWDLNFEYEGRPRLETEGSKNYYKWDNFFNISIIWRDISQIKKDIKYDKEELEL